MADERAARRRLKPPQNGSASKPCHEKRPHPLPLRRGQAYRSVADNCDGRGRCGDRPRYSLSNPWRRMHGRADGHAFASESVAPSVTLTPTVSHTTGGQASRERGLGGARGARRCTGGPASALRAMAWQASRQCHPALNGARGDHAFASESMAPSTRGNRGPPSPLLRQGFRRRPGAPGLWRTGRRATAGFRCASTSALANQAQGARR